MKVETWCDIDLYVWNWVSGIFCMKNERTTVGMYPLFRDKVCGVYKIEIVEPYRIQYKGVERRMVYLLGDVIYTL